MMKIWKLVLLLVIVPCPAASQVAVELVLRDERMTPSASTIALERSREALLEARRAIDEAILEVDQTLALLRALEVRGREEPQRPVPRNAIAGALVAGVLDALDLRRMARDLFVVVERRLAAGVEAVRPVLDRSRTAVLRDRKEKDASLADGRSLLTPALLTPRRSLEASARRVVTPFTAFEAPPTGLRVFEAQAVAGREPTLTSTAAPPPVSAPSIWSDPAHDESIVRHALPGGLPDPEEAREPHEPTLPAVERHLETLAPPEE
ncbi:MAG TPA: hypothetical protein VMT52_07015 [Planctomycetota bacterium]|nr:hypothetical protein [Planctomycetota bacterium]